MNKNYSNIITPPDFPTDAFHSVLLIDPVITEIETLAMFLGTATLSFNVYVYQTSMNDQKWLAKALKAVNAVVINTVQNEGSAYKDKLAVKTSTYHYGEKNFLMNKNHIQNPIDYFISHISLQQGVVETNGI